MSGSDIPTLPQALASASIPQLVGRLKAEHAVADKVCKHVQAFREEAGIPAINEMRYAGYHISLALNDQGMVFDRDNLLKAIGHVQRAAYEAAEAGILNCLDQISLFKTQYSFVPIIPAVPDWIDVLDKANSARDRLGAPRQTGDDRWLDHEQHVAIFDALEKVCRRLDVAREELNKNMADRRSSTSRWRITAVVAIFALMVTIIVALRHWNDSDKTNETAPAQKGRLQPL